MNHTTEPDYDFLLHPPVQRSEGDAVEFAAAKYRAAFRALLCEDARIAAMKRFVNENAA